MWFLKLLPGIGSVVTGITDYLNKKQDVDLEKYKVDGKVDQSLIAAEVSIIQARAGALSNLSWIHKGFGLVTLLYYTAIVYDALTEKLFPSVHWDVMELKGLAAIWAGMIVGFFFLQPSIISAFKR